MADDDIVAFSGEEDLIGDDGDIIDIETVFDVPVKISIELGRTKIPINQLLKLKYGQIIEFDKKVEEPVNIFVNNRLIAKGEVVIVDEKVGITMTEIINNEPDPYEE